MLMEEKWLALHSKLELAVWQKQLVEKNNLNSVHRVSRPPFATTKNLQNVKLMAERVGFEPTVPLTVHKLSKPAP